MPLVKPTEEKIAAAVDALRRGELVAFPTDTVYGLGADARQAHAVAQIFEMKGRPQFNPLIVHVRDLAAAQQIAKFTPLAEKLAKAFWPGALTFVLPKRRDSGICDLVCAGLETIAVRVPRHAVAQALLGNSDLVIAAPSANRSGRVSPTQAEHVEKELSDGPAYILDGGACDIGVESTIVGFSPDSVHLLRAGGVTREELEAVIGAPVLSDIAADPNAPTAPGQLLSHYAPEGVVRLNVVDPREDEGYLAFGGHALQHSGPVFNLSETGDLREAAANLFGALRWFDLMGVKKIAVAPIPSFGLGEAINDRLKRAAAPRGE